MNSTPPTVLSVHNSYRERGGEDEVFEAEADVLERHGWRVLRWTTETREPARLAEKVRMARNTFWSADQRRQLAKVLASERVDIAHVHNTFPLISPAVVDACRDAGVPVVLTLHNYRLLCASAMLFRDGRPCEDCVGKAIPWPALLHRCYQGSLPRTSVVSAAGVLHRILGAWIRRVDLFIVLSEFSRSRFIEAGFPADRLYVRPNFIDGEPESRRGPGRYAVYVGRLSVEKGVRVLLDAWADLDVPLKIVGSGPLADEVAAFAAKRAAHGVEYLGRRRRTEVFEILRSARFLVFPSLSYECCPLTILEAFASGVPVLASRRGAASEFVRDGENGWTVPAGDAALLSGKAETAWNDLAGVEACGHRARRVFEERFTRARGYAELMKAYARVLPDGETGLPGRPEEASRGAA